jgi:uncharacterized phage-associated protein
MATADDVAAYIIDALGPVTPMKLQKLLFYCQAWHLVCDGKRLFPEEIRAWEHGPVVQEVWQRRAGSKERLLDWPEGDVSVLSRPERNVVDAVLTQYGTLTASQLRGLSHNEDPWCKARAQSQEIIDPEELRAFYADQLDDALDLSLAERARSRREPLIAIDDLGQELGW